MQTQTPAVPPEPVPDRLRWSTIGTYGLPAAGVNFQENLIAFYLLKFATDVLGVAAGWMGLAFGLSRLWDAFSDPLVGYWSDRTHSRHGRRRPWLALSVAPLGLCFLALWSPPHLGPGPLAWWMAGAVVLFFTAQTAFQVPHLALGAELSPDSGDRTRVFAGRLAVSLAGVLAAALALGVIEQADHPRRVAFVIAAAIGVATVAMALFAVARLHEPAAHQGRGPLSPYRGFGDVMRNRQARILLSVVFLESLGFASMTTSLAFASEYAFDLGGLTSVMLAAALVSMLVSLPLWLRLAEPIGRQRLWGLSLAGRAVAFGLLFFLPVGQLVTLVCAVVVIGALFGCGGMLGPSVKADVIDGDERTTGERKEATYFATWNLSAKSAVGAAIVLNGLVLELAGFVPNEVQSPAAKLAIRILFAGLPCAFYALAAVLLPRLDRGYGAGKEPRVAGLRSRS